MARGYQSLLLGVAVALAATLSGCSASLPKTAPVQGKVVFKNGKPLVNATVQFIPVSETDTYIANGTTDPSGAFQMQTYFGSRRATVDGAVPGKYKVIVTPYPRGQRIARQYGSANETPLTVEVPSTGASNLTLTVAVGP